MGRSRDFLERRGSAVRFEQPLQYLPFAMHVYLDHNSTTWIDADAARAVEDALRAHYGNPASQHGPGRLARQKLAEYREQLAAILGANRSPRSARVVFTSGGTEANNLAILGTVGRPPASIVVSAMEHPSVTRVADQLRRTGFDVRTLPTGSDGVAEVERLSDLIDSTTRLVCLMLAHNETGVLQPVRRAAEICAAAGVPLHCDAAQAAGKVSVDFSGLGVASLALGAHKFNGPRGIGALLIAPDRAVQPMLWGGAQQHGLRPGTEDVALVAGMCAALANWQEQGEVRRRRMTELRDRFERRLLATVSDAAIIGRDSPRLSQTSLLVFPGLNRQALFLAADLAGIAISMGSACASGSSEPSPTLQSMGLESSWIESAVRVSFGYQTSADELDFAADTLAKISQNLREKLAVSRDPRPSRRG